jgi:hypothetical protein
MGIGTEAIRPPASTARRWRTTKLTQGPITGTTGIISLHRRLSTWTRTRCLIATPTHEAEAFVRPMTSPRESQALQALNRMERIMERRMERQLAAASSASSKQLQAFIGQGEFFSIISWKFLKISFHGV